MELRHGREGVEPRGKESPRKSRLKYFAGAAVLAAGLAIIAGRDAKVVKATVEHEPTASIVRTATCESIFDRNAEMRIERLLSNAVRSHTRELRARVSGSGDMVVNFSLGVDREGRISIQDAWTTPESSLSPRDIAEITRPGLGSIRLEAPPEGHMCSYSMPVVVDSQS